MKNKMKRLIDNKFLFVLFLVFIVIIPFCFRVFPIRTTHYWDESVYLQHAEIFYNGFDNYSEFDFRPVFLSFAISFFYLFYHNEIMAHFVVSFLSILGCVFIYLLGKELYHEKIGVISALSYAYLPLLITWSRFISTDSVASSFIIMSIYFFVRMKKYDYVFAGLFFAISVMTKFTSLLIFSIFILFFLFKKVKFNYLVKVFFFSLIFIIPYLIFAQYKAGFFLIPFIKGSFLVLDKNVSYLYYFYNLFSVLNYVIFGLFAYLIMLFLNRNKILDGKLFFDYNDLVLILFSLIFLLYMTKTPHKELRYIIPLVFGLILISSKGLYYLFKLKDEKRFNIFLIIFIIFLLAFSIYQFDSRLIQDYDSEAKVVATWMKDNLPNDSIVYSNAEFPVIAYYSGLKTYPVYPLNENIYEILYHKLDKPGYFVTSITADQYTSSEKVHPTEKYLSKDNHFTLVKAFDTYRIYKYEPTVMDFSWVLKLSDIDSNFYLDEILKTIDSLSGFSKGDALIVLGRLKNNDSLVCLGSDIFRKILTSNKEELALAYETVAALNCMKGDREYYLKAALIWDELNVKFRAYTDKNLYYGNATFTYDIHPLILDTNLTHHDNFSSVIFGSSKFVLNLSDVLVTQAERVSRDWLSVQFNSPYSDKFLNVFSERFSYDYDNLRPDIGWHEGSRVKDFSKVATVKVASGTLALKVNDEWYAPDENGVFRFLISKEKIYYPTTRFLREDLALIIDTHGINTLVEQAIRNNATVVLGCCDLPSKIEAALYLNTKGIKVICPTDRFLYYALLKNSSIIGSSSYEFLDEDNILVGGRPLTLFRNETIVVMNISDGQMYYDSPTRYFSYLNISNARYVTVNEGEIDKIVLEALDIDSHFIAARVFSKSDYEVLKDWLNSDERNRLMLFHSVSYPYGYLLMNEYKFRVTFDDPNPIFS